MNIDRILTVIGIVIGAIVAIYLAWRQGVFNLPRLRVGFYFADVRWLVSVGITPCQSSDILITLPLLIENTGNAPLQDLWVQIMGGVNRDYRTTGLETSAIYGEVLKSIITTEDSVFIHYEIPVLRTQQRMILGIPMLLRQTDFRPWNCWFQRPAPSEDQGDQNTFYIVDQIHCHVRVANHNPIGFQTWLLVVMPSTDVSELSKKSIPPIESLLKDTPPARVKIMRLIRSRLFSQPYFEETFLCIQPSLKFVQNPHSKVIAIDRVNEGEFFKATAGLHT